MIAEELEVNSIYKYDDGYDEKCDAKVLSIDMKNHQVRFIDSEDFDWYELTDDIPKLIKGLSNVKF